MLCRVCQRFLGDPERSDLNLKSAYLHVIADALTSVLAIAALLAAKYYGLTIMDPLMGIVGVILVTRWAFSLMRATSGILLDKQAPASARNSLRQSIEQDRDSRVADLHMWTIGPNIYAAELAIVAHQPAGPEAYKNRLPSALGLQHINIEIHQCPGDHSQEQPTN